MTLSGRRADNPARALGDLNFYVPLHRYGWVESAHQVVLHYWFDQYLDEHGQGADLSGLSALSILITGGCGYVGTKLTQAVLDRTPHDGHRPRHACGSATICRRIRG